MADRGNRYQEININNNAKVHLGNINYNSKLPFRF